MTIKQQKFDKMVALLYVQHLKKDLCGDTDKGGIFEAKGLYYSREEDIDNYSKGREHEGRSRSLCKKLPRKLTFSSLAIPLHKIQNIKLALS